MANEWQDVLLGEVIELKRGYDLPASKREEGPVPIISSSGISGFHSEAKIKAPGVVTGRYGTIGQVFYIEEDYWPLNTALYVRDFKGNDPKFISYLLRTLAFQAFSDKAAVPGVNRNHVHQAQVSIPPLDEQYRIAHTLGTLDDKIELNRQLNATLQQLARTLFQSWFVNFDPVRAKASGESEESICQRLGLTPELLALFPATLQDSAMGKIPAGWRLDRVGNLVNTVDYVANGSFASLKENVRLFNEPNYALYLRLTDFNADFSNEMRFVDETSYNFLSKSSLDGSETIIANVGANAGTVFRAPNWLGYRMTLGSNAVALKAPKACNYVYQYFESNYGQSQLQSIITGSAQPKFNKTSLRSLPLMMPSEVILHSYENLAGGIINQQDLLKAESRTLATLRDELLPKLLSGEIRLN